MSYDAIKRLFVSRKEQVRVRLCKLVRYTIKRKLRASCITSQTPSFHYRVTGSAAGVCAARWLCQKLSLNTQKIL